MQCFYFVKCSVLKHRRQNTKKVARKIKFPFFLCCALPYVYKIYCGSFSEEVNDETKFTLDNINRRFCGEDFWKTAFDEGITREDVLKDDNLMKHEHKQWRYDYAFVTKSGNTCSKYCELLSKYCKALSKYVHAATYINLHAPTNKKVQQQVVATKYAKKRHEATRKKCMQ